MSHKLHKEFISLSTNTQDDNENSFVYNIHRRRSILRSTHKAVVQVRPFKEGSVRLPELRTRFRGWAMALRSRCWSNSIHCQSLSSRRLLRLRPKRSINGSDNIIVVHWGSSVPAAELLERAMALTVELYVFQLRHGCSRS